MDIGQWEFAYVPTTGVRRAHETPVILATEASLNGYGSLVEHPRTFPIEIVRWPAQGRRHIDLNSGDQGGVTEGLVRHFLVRRRPCLYLHPNVGTARSCRWMTRPSSSIARAASMPGSRSISSKSSAATLQRICGDLD